MSDSIDVDQVAPFLDNPVDQEINEGDSFFLELNATDYSEISDWWLNDTEYFSIDSTGIVVNATALALGSYGLQVSVNDTLGYTTSVDFTISVIMSTTIGTGIDTMTLTLIAGGVIALVVIVVLVMKVKKP